MSFCYSLGRGAGWAGGGCKHGVLGFGGTVCSPSAFRQSAASTASSGLQHLSGCSQIWVWLLALGALQRSMEALPNHRRHEQQCAILGISQNRGTPIYAPNRIESPKRGTPLFGKSHLRRLGFPLCCLQPCQAMRSLAPEQVFRHVLVILGGSGFRVLGLHKWIVDGCRMPWCGSRIL